LDIMVLVYILTFAMLLLLSAFFSASETAFFSLSAADLDRMKNKKDSLTRQVVQLMSQPKKLLISIIIGNTIVNISAASLAAILTLDICKAVGLDPEIGLIIVICFLYFFMILVIIRK